MLEYVLVISIYDSAMDICATARNTRETHKRHHYKAAMTATDQWFKNQITHSSFQHRPILITSGFADRFTHSDTYRQDHCSKG